MPLPGSLPQGREVLAEFVEVETGKGADALDRRPMLAEALTKARYRRRAGGRPIVECRMIDMQLVSNFFLDYTEARTLSRSKYIWNEKRI
jgi:hypothetical protein